MPSDNAETRAQAVRAAMREGYDELIAFAQTDGFQRIVTELFALPREERPGFVKRVILSPEERARRGCVAPAGILFQRSSFGDRRPTLFCIKTYLPDELHLPWQNVNLTIDDEYDDGDIPRDERAWRQGLPFDYQAALIAEGLDPKTVVDL